MLATDQCSSPSSRKRQLIFATDGEGDDEGSLDCQHPKQRRKSDEALRDDHDNPFTSGRKDTGVAPFSLFTSASRLPLHSSSSQTHSRSSSPEVPPQPDYSSWFASGSDSALELDTTIPPPLFQSAKSKLAATPVVVPGLALKKMDQTSGWITPSETALKKAQEKMKGWQEGDPSFTPASPRPILHAVQNSASQLSPVRTPSTPTPSGFGVSSALLKPPNIPGKPTPFKSPLLSMLPSSSSKPSTHASWDCPPSSSPFKSAGQHPLTSIPQSTPAYSTPARPMGAPSRPLHEPRPGRPKFVTPFKAGMRPGEAGRQVLQQKAVKPTPAPGIRTGAPRNVVTPASKTHVAVGCSKWMAFDTTIPLNRQTLKSSGLTPQAYNSDELESFGINVSELSKITPALAIYYSFHTRSSSPPAAQVEELLDPAAALTELHARGCTLAKQDWVDNHWCLILWKLAGMVALDPTTEREGKSRRWCWNEVVRQLLYRYQRELHTAQRPALRLITTQDAPASSPLVLCISNITWSEAGVTDDGHPIKPHPELEVTDGWYRLRAQADAPLARAVRRGAIRVGRKIGVVGARLSSERKDPLDILEAYNSTKLILTGNSSHLAPWHAKLGFQSGPPPISTLNKLTPDGGVVGVMEVEVLKVYPVAFIEFIEGEDGEKRREGPWNEKEEQRVMEKWKARREVEVSNLRAALDKKLDRMEKWANRLERKAGGSFKPSPDDVAPDHIENIYSELEDTPDPNLVFARLNAHESGWLALHILDQALKDRENISDEIESELRHTCPPREVRNFRVLSVRDARVNRRPSGRTAQLTVWDALALKLAEGGKGGDFKEGQRFQVTNLIPTQKKAWMGHEEGAEVYLSTRRDSRWRSIR